MSAVSARSHISAPPPDPMLAAGAKEAIVGCLRVQRGERVAVVTHKGEVAPIGAALVTAAKDVGAIVEAYVVDPTDAVDPRFETALLSKVAECEVSILVSSLDGLPVELRRRLVAVGSTKRRHGHMIGITHAMMLQSMRADYGEVVRVTRWLADRLKPTSILHATTPNGTDLEVRLDPHAKLGIASGVLEGPGWTNLPGGEVFGVPARVEGVLAIDGGAWMPDGTELPHAFRMRVHFARGEVARIDGPADSCQRLEKVLDASAGARRVGQFGFGTNTGIVAPIGALLQDLKLPGFHLSLGHTAPEVTGASFDSDVEIPLLTRRASVTVDGEPVLVAGRYPPTALRLSSRPPSA